MSRQLERWLWLPLLALIYTAVQINRSSYCGSLSMPVTYDDCWYYHQCALLTDVLKQQGPIPFLKLFVRPEYLYTPATSALCIFSFTTLGYCDWGPKALNVFPLYALLVFLCHQARFLPPTWRLLVLAVALAAPMTGHLIIDTRADVLCGLGTAAAVVLILSGPWLAAERSRWFKVGALAGVTMLYRPHAVPLAAVLLLFGSCLSLLTESSARNHLFKASGTMLMGLFGVMLPYFAFALPNFVAYFARTEFGKDRELWTYKAGLAAHLSYYFTPTVRQLTMGTWLWPCLGTLALAGGLCLVCRDGNAGRRAFSYLLIMLATWSALTIEAAKMAEYGYMLYAQLAVAGLMALIYILHRSLLMSGLPRVGLQLACALVSCWWLASYSWPELARPWGLRQQHQIVMDSVCREIQADSRPSPIVYFTNLGVYLNPYSLGFYLHRNGRSILTISREHSSKVAEHREIIDAADWIVAFSADNPSRLTIWEDNKIQADLLRLLDADPALSRRQFQFEPGQGSVYLYCRDRTKPPYPFCGTKLGEGFGPLGSSLGQPGPPNYFATRLNKARIPRLVYTWGPVSKVQIEIPASGEASLKLSCFAQVELELSLQLDGQRPQVVKVGPDLRSYELGMRGIQGQHTVSITASQPVPIAFTKIQTIPGLGQRVSGSSEERPAP